MGRYIRAEDYLRASNGCEVLLPTRNAMLRNTQLASLTGHPAITVPCGATGEKLPVGAQIVGARGATARLLQTTRAVEPYFGPGASR